MRATDRVRHRKTEMEGMNPSLSGLLKAKLDTLEDERDDLLDHMATSP